MSHTRSSPLRRILAGMRRTSIAGLAVRFAVVVALLVSVAFGVSAGCYFGQDIWFCFDPATGKESDNAPYDENHYVNGVFDPCHCYDPCGSAASCPILVDAGPPGPGCAGDAGGG